MLLFAVSVSFQSCAVLMGEGNCETKAFVKLKNEYSLDLNLEKLKLIHQNIECGEDYNFNAVSFLLNNIFSGHQEKPLRDLEIAFLSYSKNKKC